MNPFALIGLIAATHLSPQQPARKNPPPGPVAHPAPNRPPAAKLVAEAPPPAGPDADLETLQRIGIIPANAKGNGIITEQQFSILAARLARQQNPHSATVLAVTKPAAPVSRIRALTALVRLLIPQDSIQTDHPQTPITPDAKEIPQWGIPYAVTASDQGWWNKERPLLPRENATWSFVAAILARTHAVEAMPAAPRPAPAAEPDAYTGLIVDATSLTLQRTPNLRILDQDGSIIYPDPKYLPDFDFLQDQGLASYVNDSATARRAGSRPLTVPAVGVAGVGNDDIVVTVEVARRILDENRRGRFLWRWAIAVLVKAGD